MNYVIRNFDEKTKDQYGNFDPLSVSLVDLECFGEGLRWSPGMVIKFNQRAGNVIRVAARRDNQKIIGYVAFSINSHLRRIDIRSIAVLKDFRKEGIGTRLVQPVKDTIIGNENTLRICSAYVRDWNLSAQTFYRANGFVCLEIIDDESGCDYEFTYADRSEATVNRISRLLKDAAHRR